ncbi:acetyl-CoA carboxylase biotin carboxyl carrier protein (plasmid) [Pantoea sp. C3]|uniref:acetyl-CoA carboxylase biotin carboxyl carrier protein n=1 Tax=Pantoea phytostimulans TaxID=2769024 RepID=UPI0038F746AD
MTTEESIVLTRRLLNLLESSTSLSEIAFKYGDMQVHLISQNQIAAENSQEQGILDDSSDNASMYYSVAPSPVTEPSTSLIQCELHGVFYHSPSPGAAPFVQPGDIIEDGKQIAIIEAMKMLNAVEASKKGRIVRALVKDADVVMPGTPLFEIEEL